MKKVFTILLLIVFFLFTVAFSNIIVTVSEEKVIFIDPGHGGFDGGTTYNGLIEKDIDLSFSFVLKRVLEENGYKVLMTRDGDYDLATPNSKNRKREDIQKRVNLINSSRCLLYLSIHTNSFQNKNERGAQTFYSSNNIDSKNLAVCIQDSIRNKMENTERVAMGIRDKYLIDKTRKVGCLIEIGFLSNEEEANLLQDYEYKLSLSYSILLGIEEYFKTY